MDGACSPIRPVNTIVSSAPRSREIRYQNRSTASAIEESSLSSSVRMSLDMPDTPNKPERLLHWLP
jgi:hypothetical protein